MTLPYPFRPQYVCCKYQPMINDGVAGRADGFYWPAPNDLADLVATILPDTSLSKATIFRVL